MADSDSSLPLSVLTALDEYRDALMCWAAIEREFEREEVGADILDQAAAERDAAHAALLHSLREMETHAGRMRQFGGAMIAGELLRAGCYTHGGYIVTYTDDADLGVWTLPLGEEQPALAVFSDGDEGACDAFDWLAARTPQPETRP